MYFVPLVGGVSLPSAKKCTNVLLTPARLAAVRKASRWLMWLCTPPSLTSPSRWKRPPRCLALSNADCSTLLLKNEPSSSDMLMRTRSWNSTRPTPIVRWPTSLLPITPAGRPTDRPHASISTDRADDDSESMWGVEAFRMALPLAFVEWPQPSMETSTTGLETAGGEEEDDDIATQQATQQPHSGYRGRIAQSRGEQRQGTAIVCSAVSKWSRRRLRGLAATVPPATMRPSSL